MGRGGGGVGGGDKEGERGQRHSQRMEAGVGGGGYKCSKQRPFEILSRVGGLKFSKKCCSTT